MKMSGMAVSAMTSGTSDSIEQDFNITNLNIGLLGKYPIAISNALTFFPLLGIDYQSVLTVKIDGEAQDDPGDESALWFKFGAGLDVLLSEKIFFRGEALYGIRLPSKFENDFVSELKESAPGVKAETVLGHGLTIKLAVGYRF